MLKNARFTFQKFSDPRWGYLRTFGDTYVPDEIFEPAAVAVKNYAADILRYEDAINWASRAATINTSWGWPESVDFVAQLWDDIDLVRADVFKGAVARGCIRITDVPQGRGGGVCWPGFIEFNRDLTLNDPVYLAHESGHLVAGLLPSDPVMPWNMAEMPAFFMQERAYDILRAQAATDKAKHIVDLHRLSDYVGVLTRIPFCLWVMDQQRTDTYEETLRTCFRAWAIDSDDTIKRYEDWAEDDKPLAHKAQMLHSHPLAALLMIEFYQRFKKAGNDTQAQMLSALYNKGGQTSLVDMLAVFDVHTKDDLKQAATCACDHLAREIDRCGFKTPRSPALTV